MRDDKEGRRCYLRIKSIYKRKILTNKGGKGSIPKQNKTMKGDMIQEYRHKPKKALGQHFLTDHSIVRRIVSEAGITEGTHVLEVGPGHGILTKALLDVGAIVTAVEIDRDLIEPLQKRFGDSIRLIKKDILRLNWDDLDMPEGSAIVANLPFQITSPFIFKAIAYRHLFPNVTVMIQKEVAERIISGPGTKAYGILSLKAQYYYNTSYLFTVPPYVFSPAPKVESAVIKLEPRLDAPVLDNPQQFWNLVEISFRNRRKMLRVNLKSILPKEKVDILTETGPIELTRRGETLNEEEFLLLYSAVAALF
jgi:16S rRNA (adenine1518-N6/adenine1519-N6)-dimethyltransferase